MLLLVANIAGAPLVATAHDVGAPPAGTAVGSVGPVLLATRCEEELPGSAGGLYPGRAPFPAIGAGSPLYSMMAGCGYG